MRRQGVIRPIRQEEWDGYEPMCVTQYCCCCVNLQSGVKGIAALGVVLTLVYVLLSFLGGKEIFLLLSYFNVNHFYLATFTCIFNIFVHLLLWHGSHHKQKYKLLPWLIWVMLKAMIFLSVGISATTRFIRRSNELQEAHLTVDDLNCRPPEANECSNTSTSQVDFEDRDPTRELQFTVIMYIYFMAGLHLYFWIIVYSLYARLSTRHEAYLMHAVTV